MIASYGDTSGFAPVAGNEATTVNGGSVTATILGMTIIGVTIFYAAYLIADSIQAKKTK
jgi:hypothetical protein